MCRSKTCQEIKTCVGGICWRYFPVRFPGRGAYFRTGPLARQSSHRLDCLRSFPDLCHVSSPLRTSALNRLSALGKLPGEPTFVMRIAHTQLVPSYNRECRRSGRSRQDPSLRR